MFIIDLFHFVICIWLGSC